MTPEQSIEEALQLLRRARNNMKLEDFQQTVNHLCLDGNNRYPLLEAGMVALDSHKHALRDANVS